MTKNEIEKLAYDILRQRKYHAQQTARENLFRARNNPAFFEIDSALRALEIEIAKANKEEKSQLAARKDMLQKERERVLVGMGMTPKDLEPKPICPLCHDSGTHNGKQCKCLKNIILSKLLEESGVSAKDLVSFDSFDENVAPNEKQRAMLAKYKKFLQEVAEKFPNQRAKCITICGNTGTGKTFGAKCLVREVLKKQEPALFLTAFELSSLMLKFHTAFVQDKNAIMSTLLEPELLVIDDLGTEPILKKVTLEYLYVILSERLAKGKTTFITTNLSLSHILDQYGERIFSRLSDKKLSQLIELSGSDLRHNKK